MTENEDIDDVRNRWLNSRSQGLGCELLAYLALLDHSLATWQDLVLGLQSTGIVAEQAWLRFRTEFKELEPSGKHRIDSAFWLRVLADRGFNPTAPWRAHRDEIAIAR